MIKQMQINNSPSLKIQAYLIDTIKIDSTQHHAFKKFQKIIFQHFPTIISIRFVPDNKQLIEFLGIENLSPFTQVKSLTISKKLIVLFSVLKTLWFLHQRQFFMGNKSIGQYLYQQNKYGKIKIKPYMMFQIRDYKFGEPKKDKNIAKNGIQLCFDYQKQHQALDIWKWAVFAAQILFQFSLDKYIDKLFSFQKQKLGDFVPQLSNLNNFENQQIFRETLIKCLNPIPTKRPKIPQIIQLFHQINLQNSISLTTQNLNHIKSLYSTRQQSLKSQTQFQIIQNILLTDQLKKKLSSYFTKYGNKAPKSYKPLYRATRYDFNTRVYYESCLNKGKLLFVIQTQLYGIICFYLQPTLILDESEGIQGKFITDPQTKSWLYSSKNGESYKLTNKDKVYKSVPGRGPIIGDGDLIIGSSPTRNYCYFPKSFQIGKSKQFIPQIQFTLKNYDVYQVTL